MLAGFRSLTEEGALEFERFFSANYDRTRRILAVILEDPLLGEEATQEAFFRAYKRWSRVEQMERPEGWVLVVGMNHGRDLLRNQGRAFPTKGGGHSTSQEADSAASISLVAAIAGLPPRQQQAIALRYLLDMTIEEAAKAMGCAIGTAKSTVHAALKSLKVQMEESVDT